MLGGVLLQRDVLLDLAELETDDFYDARHRVVWAAIRALEHANEPIDVVTLQAQIARTGQLDALGGVAFLGQLVLEVPTADNVRAYAEIVRKHRVARRLMLVASEILEAGYRSDLDVDEYVTEAQGAISAIERANPDETRTIGDLASARFADLERFAQAQLRGEKLLSGFPTGVAALDAKVGGWPSGIVSLIAARPGMGKSSLALASADACSRAGIGVHVFSLEDSEQAYADRQLARLSGVPAIAIRRAEFRGQETGALFKAMVDLKARKGWLVDSRGALSALDMVRAMRRHQVKNGTKVAICDYLQLLKRRDSRMKEHEHLGDCMQTFAESAKVDGIAWVVLSQFNRELEKRPDRRPMLSDLRGSGEIEEKTKFAVGMYRGAYYGGKPKRNIDWECACPASATSCAHAPSDDAWEQQLQLLILKGGNGPTGLVMASWDGPTTRVW